MNPDVDKPPACGIIVSVVYGSVFAAHLSGEKERARDIDFKNFSSTKPHEGSRRIFDRIDRIRWLLFLRSNLVHSVNPVEPLLREPSCAFVEKHFLDFYRRS